MITFDNDFSWKLDDVCFYYKCCFTLNSVVENLMPKKIDNCE